MKWFWYFTIYSFLGFLLEVAFSKVSHGHPDRKCLLIFPLCPVYGLGACAFLFLAPLAGGNPVGLFLLGTAACTAAEYIMAVWYERGLRVSFWDYSGWAGNLHGRICPLFSAAWGFLTLVSVFWIQPTLEHFISGIPAPLTGIVLTAVLLDIIISSRMLYLTGDRACLQWYKHLALEREAREAR